MKREQAEDVVSGTLAFVVFSIGIVLLSISLVTKLSSCRLYAKNARHTSALRLMDVIDGVRPRFALAEKSLTTYETGGEIISSHPADPRECAGIIKWINKTLRRRLPPGSGLRDACQKLGRLYEELKEADVFRGDGYYEDFGLRIRWVQGALETKREELAEGIPPEVLQERESLRRRFKTMFGWGLGTSALGTLCVFGWFMDLRARLRVERRRAARAARKPE